MTVRYKRLVVVWITTIELILVRYMQYLLSEVLLFSVDCFKLLFSCMQFIAFSLGILKKQMEGKKLDITEAGEDTRLKPLVSYYTLMLEGSQGKGKVLKNTDNISISDHFIKVFRSFFYQ